MEVVRCGEWLWSWTLYGPWLSQSREPERHMNRSEQSQLELLVVLLKRPRGAQGLLLLESKATMIERLALVLQ